jgi:hypothetical protein
LIPGDYPFSTIEAERRHRGRSRGPAADAGRDLLAPAGRGDFARIVGTKSRHQKTKPFTPRHNTTVERYQRTLAGEMHYAWAFNCEGERAAAIGVWIIHQ